MNLIEKVKSITNGAEILSEWLGAGARTVGKELAQQRAGVCLACPLNVKSVITESIGLAIKRQLEIKSHLELRVDGEKKLHTCSACGCALRLKIHVPIENILPEPQERGNFDGKCWMLQESKNYEISTH